MVFVGRREESKSLNILLLADGLESPLSSLVGEYVVITVQPLNTPEALPLAKGERLLVCS